MAPGDAMVQPEVRLEVGRPRWGAVIPEVLGPQPHISGSMPPTHPSARSAGTGKVVGIRAQWEALPSQL